MRVLGIIPARAGSKRLPGKNTRLLGGKPLVAWAIEAALGAARLDRLVVSSDDPVVLEIARGYGEALPLERPAELATDEALAIDVVRHALQVVEGAAALDAFAIIQCTSPFTKAGDIDATLDLLERSGADSAVSVAAIDFAQHPAKLKELDGDRLRPYWEDEAGRMAQHELPQLYARNGSVYASRCAVLETGRLLGEDCRGYVMPRERSVDINDAMDFAFAAFLISGAQRVEC